MIKTKGGYVRVWRICYNLRSNDWNDEPEKIIVPYAIIDERKNSYNVVRMGWGYGKKQQHCLPKNQFYFSPEEAEVALKGGK